MLGDNLVIVIEGGTADQTEDAAAALAARFKKRADLFDNVFAPAVDPFFRETAPSDRSDHAHRPR